MSRKLNRFLAILLAIALVTTTFGSDMASTRAFAVESEEELKDLSEGSAQESTELEWESFETDEEDGEAASEVLAEENGNENENIEGESAETDEAAPESEENTPPSDEATEGAVVEPVEGATNGGEVKEEPATEAASNTSASETAASEEESAAEATSAATLSSIEESAVASTTASTEEAADAASSASTEKEEKLVTITYQHTMGGRVSNTKETIDLNDEDAKFEGSEAIAWNRYQFTEWVNEDGETVSTEAMFIPSDVEKDTTFTAKFMKLEEMPEISESKVDGGMKISVTADEGLFPDGTTVQIDALDDSDALTRAQNTLGDSVTDAKGVDITFWYEGKEIQPADAQYVHVSISLIDKIEGTDFTVLHDHNGEVTELEDATVETVEKNADPQDETQVATSVEFDSNLFSVYIVASQDGQQTIERKTVTYTFVYGDDEKVFYEQTVISGDELKNPGNPPQLDNNVFKGWYIDGEDEKLSLPMTIESTDDLDVNIKVVARYEETYYVTFHGVDGGIHDIKSVTIEGNETPYVQVDDEEVAAPTNMQAFKGWTTVEGDRSTLIVADESGTCRVNAKLVKDVYPLIIDAFWVQFDENDDTVIIVDGEAKPVSGGASYTGPQFLESGEALSKARQADPTRNGYIFAGWSFDAEGNEMVLDSGEKSWESEIQKLVPENENTITLYAQWTPVEETKYTIVVWKQKITDHVGDEEKHYDFYISDDTNVGRTGDEIPYSSYAQYTSLATSAPKDFEGFYYAGTEIVASKVVAPNTIGPKGDTVVNVYYDRKTMNLVFSADGIGEERTYYKETTDNSGKQYGIVDGEYVPLTSHTGWILFIPYTYWTYGNNITYDGTRYKLVTEREGSITYTGLFGQELQYANSDYTWPAGLWYGKKSDGAKSYVTFFSNFLFNGWTTEDTEYESTLRLTRESEQSGGNRHIYFYKQGFDGIDEYHKYILAYDYTCDVNTSFTSRGDYFTGFSPYKYKKGNDGYTKLEAGTEITIDSNTSLYYSRNKYTLTFFYNTQPGEPNTMSKEVSDIYYEADISNVIDQAPLKVKTEEELQSDNSEFKFVGWYADDTLTTPFDWNTTMPAANVSVYAKWEVKRYNVKINFDGGTNPSNVLIDFNVDYGEKVSKTALMGTTKEGWKLAGWIYDVEDPEAGHVFNFGATVRNIKIKALWKKSGNISVVYNAGEHGTNAPVDTESYAVESGVVVAIPPSVNDGWAFTGWKLGENLYAPGASFKITSDIVTDNVVTLVAQYVKTTPSSLEEEETTSIIYDPNGGTDGENTTAVTINENDDGEPLRVNESVTALTVEQAKFAKTGYKFIGWNTDSEATTAIISGGKKYIAANNLGNGNILYAIWEELPKYTIRFVDDDGTEISSAQYVVGTKAEDIVKPANPTKAATAQYTYTFDKWTPEIADVTGDATYTATYTSTVNQYTVKFVDEDGTTELLEEKSYDYGTAVEDIEKPTDPTKAATAQYTYEFAGWTPELEPVTRNIVYKATYSSTVNKYTVTYTDGAAKGEAFDPQEITDIPYGDPTPEFDGTPHRIGWTFDGWLPEVAETVTESVKYEAQWTELPRLTVTINGNSSTTGNVYNGSSYSVSGYTVDISPKIEDKDAVSVQENSIFSKAKVSGEDANVTYTMDITAEDFSVTSDKYIIDEIKVNPGQLRIDPLKVRVTITGKNDTVQFTGKEQSVTGYGFDANSPLYKQSMISFAGQEEPVAKGTIPGRYEMNLTAGTYKAGQFTNTNQNFDVTFVVTNGYLVIGSRVNKFNLTLSSEDVPTPYNGLEQSYTIVAGLDAPISSNAVANTILRIAQRISNFFTFTASAASGTINFKIDGVEYVLEGASITAKGKDVGKYAFTLDDKPVVKLDGKDVTSEFSIDATKLGNLVISQAPIVITVSDATKVEGNADPTFTGSISGVLGSDVVTVAYARAAGEAVGTPYAITTARTVAELAAEYPNYTFTVNPGTFLITAAPSTNPTTGGGGDTPAGGDDTPAATPTAPTPVAPAPAAAPAPAPAGAVLGARRGDNANGDGKAVLGARRSKTDDETNDTRRVFSVIIAAAVALSLMATKKRKEEDD